MFSVFCCPLESVNCFGLSMATTSLNCELMLQPEEFDVKISSQLQTIVLDGILALLS